MSKMIIPYEMFRAELFSVRDKLKYITKEHNFHTFFDTYHAEDKKVIYLQWKWLRQSIGVSEKDYYTFHVRKDLFKHGNTSWTMLVFKHSGIPEHKQIYTQYNYE